MKRVRERKKVLSPSTENDYSDWYRRDAIEMEGKIKAKDGQLKQVESHFYDVLSKYNKKSPLFLHLCYKTYEKREASKLYDKDVLKARFKSNTETLWRPQICVFFITK